MKKSFALLYAAQTDAGQERVLCSVDEISNKQ